MCVNNELRNQGILLVAMFSQCILIICQYLTCGTFANHTWMPVRFMLDHIILVLCTLFIVGLYLTVLTVVIVIVIVNLAARLCNIGDLDTLHEVQFQEDNFNVISCILYKTWQHVAYIIVSII